MTERAQLDRLAQALAAAMRIEPAAREHPLVRTIAGRVRDDRAAGSVAARSDNDILTAERVATRAGRERNTIAATAPAAWRAIADIAGFYLDKPGGFDLDAELRADSCWRTPAWSMTLLADEGEPPDPFTSFHAAAVFRALGPTVWWIDRPDRIAAAGSTPQVAADAAVAARVDRGDPALAVSWNGRLATGLAGDDGLIALCGTLHAAQVQAIVTALAAGPAGMPLYDRAGLLCFGPDVLRRARGIPERGIRTRAVLAAPDLTTLLWRFEGSL